MKQNEDQTTNLINATDEEIARLNKTLAKQARTKMVYTVIGGVAVAVAGSLLKHALNMKEIEFALTAPIGTTNQETTEDI